MAKYIIIKVEGGCVVDVLNLPKHYKYIIDDADERDEDRKKVNIYGY